MAEPVLVGLPDLFRYLHAKRFKHGIDGRLLASIGAELSRITKRELGKDTKPISEHTQSLRNGRGYPLNDDGHLKASIQWDRRENGIELGSALRYARIHQEGGVIKPKNAQKLAIPATREAKKLASTVGVRRALEVLGDKYGEAFFTDWGIFTGKVKQFFRRDSVTIPARPYLIWDQFREDAVSTIVLNYLEDAKGSGS